jgi:DNA-binding NarL/FixJ family response regulator
MTEGNIRVVVVDDHMLVHEAVGSLMRDRDDMVLVGSAITGVQATRLVGDLKPDVVVIDIALLDMNGLVLAQRITTENPAVNVVVLSMHEDRAYVRRALGVGVKAYVSKRSRGAHLLQAISVAAEGGVYIDPTIVPRLLGEKGASASGRVFCADDLGSNLTERESEVVRLVALGNTAKEIAGQLDVTVKSVETYKARACEKLNMKTRSQLVRFAAIQGWLTEV